MGAIDVDRLMLGLTALTLAGVAAVALRRSPRLVALGWVVVLAFVPVWVGVPVVVFWQADVLVTLLALMCLLPLPRHWTWSVVDAVMATLMVVVLLELVTGLTTLSATFEFATAWFASYALGRIVGGLIDVQWLYGAVGIVFTVVAAAALAEFVSGVNVFTRFLTVSNSLYTTWGPLQARGGVVRAEAAFGHSIALGCSLGIAIALTLASRLPPVVRLGMVAMMGAASLVTFSRTGMLTCVASVLLTAVFGKVARERWLRPTVAALVVVGGLVFWFAVRQVFTSAGDESSDSAGYRRDLLALVSDMAPFGVSDSYTRSTTGVVSVGSFRSIDNAALLLGLTYGWVVLLVVGALLVVAGVLLMKGRAEAPVVALVAQLPAFVTVALITQYALFVWFVAGLAVAGYHARESGRPGHPEVPAESAAPLEVVVGGPIHLAGAEQRSER